MSRPHALLAALVVAAPGCSGPGLPPVELADAGPRPDLGGADPAAPLFDPAHIVEVDIRLPAADWDALRLQARTVHDIFSNCLKGPFADPFTYFRGAVTIDGQPLTDVAVRKKGFLGSLDPNRPSLKLKFDEYAAGRRFAGLKTFTLNNSRQDPSFLHQCLAYRTFAAAGVPASRCNFAHVRVNGADLGLYVHVESGSQDFLARHFVDPDGNLYEGTLSDFRDGWTATFELKTNERANDRRDLAPVVAALQAPDGELLARLEPVVDVDRFLTFWAVESLIGHWDGYAGDTNNFYAYHNPSTGKFEFMPWGTDATFANRPGPGGQGGPTSVLAVSLLARRLYLHPPTRDRYLARLRELLARHWDEAGIRGEIDRMERLITPLADPRGDAGLAARIQAVRAFVAGRRGAIEAELAKGPPVWSAPLRNAPCFVPIGSLSGSLQTTWGTVGNQDPLRTGSGTLAGTLHGAPLQVLRVGSVAGVDPKAAPPAPAQLAVVAQLGDGTAGVVAFSMSPARFRPNTTLPVDLSTVNGAVYRQNPATMKLEPVGIFSQGTLRLVQAGVTPGAPVSATFSGTIVKQPF